MDQLQPISGPPTAESCEVPGEKECARSNQCGSCGVRFRFFAGRGLGEHTGVGRFYPYQSNADASGIGIAGRAEGTLSRHGSRSSGEVLTDDNLLSARDSKKIPENIPRRWYFHVLSGGFPYPRICARMRSSIDSVAWRPLCDHAWWYSLFVCT